MFPTTFDGSLCGTQRPQQVPSTLHAGIRFFNIDQSSDTQRAHLQRFFMNEFLPMPRVINIYDINRTASCTWEGTDEEIRKVHRAVLPFLAREQIFRLQTRYNIMSLEFCGLPKAHPNPNPRKRQRERVSLTMTEEYARQEKRVRASGLQWPAQPPRRLTGKEATPPAKTRAPSLAARLRNLVTRKRTPKLIGRPLPTVLLSSTNTSFSQSSADTTLDTSIMSVSDLSLSDLSTSIAKDIATSSTQCVPSELVIKTLMFENSKQQASIRDLNRHIDARDQYIRILQAAIPGLEGDLGALQAGWMNTAVFVFTSPARWIRGLVQN